MKLRTQVIALAGLLVLLPLGGLIGLVLSHQAQQAPDIPLVKLAVLEQWVRTHLKINSQLQIQVLPHAKTSLFTFEITNNSGHVVYSTLLPAVLGNGDSHPERAVLPLTQDGKVAGQIVVDFRDLDSQPAPLLELTSDLAFQVLLIVLLSSLIVAWWLRRLTQNLHKLASLTRLMEVSLGTPLPWQTLKTSELREVAKSIENLRSVLNEEGLQRYRFLSALTHDLKTPLTSLKGYVEAIRDGLGTPEEQKHWLAVLEDKATQLEVRLQALFQFARRETKPWSLTRQQRDLCAFLNQVAEVFALDAAAWGKIWLWQNDLKPVEGTQEVLVNFDPVMTTRALENLVQNAFRYSGPQGQVRLKAWQNSEGVFVEVHDTGPGIPQEEQKNLFEPFSRGNRGGEGLGLGLYIAKEILSSQGWELFLDVSDGTSFIIKIASTTIL
ncbi:MAG: HAMP domain-containing histidine kinase [Spirochaetales bacterium]|nr:HAMP domain-containing histidine kinase [Spirochaetales bacterium]